MVFFLITEPYHLQPGTAWRAVPPAAWDCMESRTTCSMVLHGEPYHLQPGTAWRAIPHAERYHIPAVWYSKQWKSTCTDGYTPWSTMLHVGQLSIHYHAAGGMALHAVPCSTRCGWYGSRGGLSYAPTHVQTQAFSTTVFFSRKYGFNVLPLSMQSVFNI